MADLRSLVESLGFSTVRTLLNSGNIIFETSQPDIAKITVQIEAGIKSHFGFSSSVVAVTEDDLMAIIKENSLLKLGADPSRLLVAFVADPRVLTKAKALLSESWAPEAFALGGHAAYLWCPRGVIGSKLMQSLGRLAGEATTIRNWATVLKLQAAIRVKLSAT